ncbi:MAG: tetratricopeptide repeat protein [Ardenticatenaceae bacterium]
MSNQQKEQQTNPIKHVNNGLGQARASQTVEIGSGGRTQGIIQLHNSQNCNINVHIASDESERLKRELATLHEQRWQEKYERLRVGANKGYYESGRGQIVELISEIESYEKQKGQVDRALRAKIYRLAAIVHLPRQAGGDADRSAAFLAQARTLSQGDGLIEYRIVEAMWCYESGEIETALEILGDLAASEAVRLRFVIYVETNRTDECRRMIESGAVDPDRSENDPSWAAALLAYYVSEGRKPEAKKALERLLELAPTALSYQIAANEMALLAYSKVYEFCLAHEIFPHLWIGLNFDEWIDVEIQAQAAGFFAKAATLYQKEKCKQAAIKMLAAAIRLSIDENRAEENLALWATKLAELDPHHHILISVRGLDLELPKRMAGALSILDLAPLLNDSSTDPMYIFQAVQAIAKTPTAAAEVASVASILEQKREHFNIYPAIFDQYVFFVLELRRISGDHERALAWLEQAAPSLSRPHWSPLYHMWFYWHQNDLESAKIWAERALKVAPEHPEILAVAFGVYNRRREEREALELAQKLFQILGTSQTLEWYLNSLWATQEFERIIEVLNSAEKLPISEQALRTIRVQALVGLDRTVEAREDLEWLRTNGVARPFELRGLAYAYELLGEVDRAIAVLRECVEKFPEEVSAYLTLSENYLQASRLGESFEWALKAQQRFPDNPNVSTYLYGISLPTGEELHHEVREAFQSLMPGGKLSDHSPFIPISEEQVFELMRSQQAKKATLEILYKAGLVGRMTLCMTGRHVSIFLDHQLANANGEMRYVADGDQLQDIARLTEDRPRQVVLDYSALLTLWSLFGREMFSFLSKRFDRIWLPEKLRSILSEEQSQIATRGQRSIYQAQCAVRDAITRWANKCTVHARIDPKGGRDITGSHTEITVAARDKLLYLSEHTPAGAPSVPTIGIALLADLLYQAGEINQRDLKKLKNMAMPSTHSELLLKSGLKRGSQIVAEIPTLITWAKSGALMPLFEYFKHIHLSEPARNQLLSEIRGYDFIQETFTLLRSMRRYISRWEKKGLIAFGTVSAKKRIIRQLVEEQQAAEQVENDDSNHWEARFAPLLDYLDQLMGLAYHKNIPLWTDDRWTRALQIKQYQPRYCFATDALLAYALQYPDGSARLNEEAYHSYYDQLVSWGYHFLPINADHILWHLQQGRDVESKPLANLLRHYRESLINFWNLQTQAKVDTQLGIRLLGFYNQQLNATLHRLYEYDVSIETSANIFAILDISRHASSQLLGREPMFLSSLFTRTWESEVVHALAQQGGFKRVSKYIFWLSEIILASGIGFEVIEEAWYQLFRMALSPLGQAEMQDTRGMVIGMLNVIPASVTEHLLSTDIGPRLQNDLGVQIAKRFRVNLDDATETEIYLPVQELQRDYNQAINAYLQNSSLTTVSAGVVTLSFRPLAPGSVFLMVKETPIEIAKQYPDARGTLSYVSVVATFTSEEVSHRKTLWQIGQEALPRHSVPTTVWQSLKNKIMAPGRAGILAGAEARKHLLGTWPVAKEYLAQAAQLPATSVIDLLLYIEPTIVRGWLEMPALDWSSSEELIQWANQRSIQKSDKKRVSDLVNFLSRFGRGIFPDAPIVREHALTLLDSLSSGPKQRRWTRKLLSLAEKQASSLLKANLVLILDEWFNRQRHLSLWKEERERFLSLVCRVLEHFMAHKGEEATLNRLEVTISQWLYQRWLSTSCAEEEVKNEMAYLATIGASYIVDALFVEGHLSQNAALQIFETLASDIKSREIASGVEPQPNGFFRPRWGLHLNYPASYMLKTFLSGDSPPHYWRIPQVKSAALLCASKQRLEQALFSTADPSWLDTELTAEIALASVAILGQPDQSEFETWPENERSRFLLASLPNSDVVTWHAMVTGIAQLDNQEEITQHIAWLFQGRTPPSDVWFGLVQHLLTSDILNHISQFETSYGALIVYLAWELLPPDPNYPKGAELLTLIKEVVFNVPTGDKGEALIEMKARIFTNLLQYGLHTHSVCDWIQQVVQQISTAAGRQTLRPFILSWPHYPKSVREPLFNTLMEIAQQPSYKNLWEFARLIRHQQALNISAEFEELDDE